MGRLRLVVQLFGLFLLLILFCVGTLGWFVLASLPGEAPPAQVEGLRAAARLIGAAAAAPGADEQSVVREAGERSGLWVTLFDADGRVLADSRLAPAVMGDASRHPEVREALAGRPGVDVRLAEVLGERTLLVAEPLGPAGAVRVAQPLAGTAALRRAVVRALLTGSVASALLAALAAWWMARRTVRPLAALRSAAERYARGDFSERIYLARPQEVVELAKSMNRMARALDERLREVTRQRNERDAILASMREGVLALDADERILMMNRAAEEILGVTADAAVGKLVQEALRNAALQRFLGRALAGENVPAEESLVRLEERRLVQMESSPLRDEEGREAGLLVALGDVTRLHRLENVRREFVANVSHELRTPITSIKGFIETLRAGAIEDPAAAQRFLGIVQKQADRLNAIIEDLLALSRIERMEEQEAIELHNCRLRPILEAVATQYSVQAREKGIEVVVACPPDVQVRANERLLEQAVGNLLDNAIKHSPAGAGVQLRGRHDGREVLVEVEDQGSGIPAEHQERIFERFYRVDAARSRDMGGTGLGLAIVKHIAQTHGGRVTVTSEEGKGSTFVLALPGVGVRTQASNP